MNRKRSDHPIIIIGAGIAGLACANKLIEAGVDVIVLEGNNRIGGRIKTYNQGSEFFDLGASWIHGIENNPIWELTKKYKLKTTVFNYTNADYMHKNGVLYNEDEKKEIESYLKKIELMAYNKKSESALTAINYAINELGKLDSKFEVAEFRSKLFDFFSLLANDPYATELENLHSKFNDHEGYFSGDEVIFPEGYNQLIDRLSKGVNIKKNALIKNVNFEGNPIIITEENGNEYKASHVAITVSLGVLKKGIISFTPPLNSSYNNAIEKIGFGSFNKIFFSLDKPIFNEKRKTPLSLYFWDELGCFNIMDFSSEYGRPMYLMLLGGKRSENIDNLNDDEVKNNLLIILKRNFGDDINIIETIITRWGADPYSLGSFSFPSLHHDSLLVDTLNQPIDARIYFSGEHCSVENSGTVHGAYLNGCHTAIKILGNFS